MTILETLVGVAISGVFALAGWSFYRSELRTLGDHSALLEATDRARGTMAFMAREIRLTGYDPLLTAMKGVVEARADRLWIQFDVNKSGAVDATATDPNAENVLYTFDAANRQLLRTVNGSAQPLVKGLAANGVLFEYFDLLGNALNPSGSPAVLSAVQRDLIALVRLTLRVDASGTTRPTTLALTSRVAVPNRILDRL